MTVSGKNIECLPLLDACSLTLYEKNIFRLTGLPVDATAKEVSRQAQKLQMLEEMGGDSTLQQPAFPPMVPPTTDELRAALSRMREPEHRIVDEFFWYWPEVFGESKNDSAIQAMLAGNTEGAIALWRDREKSGSHAAKHNMAIMYHMFAVDWTNHHILYGIKQDFGDEIKTYWKKSFERWEELIERDEIWDMLKARIRSLEDEALTTGFARRMLKQLPSALDKVNAEAALRLAEQGSWDWARFHVDFMNETHQGIDDVESTSEMVLEPTKIRVEQYLESFQKQATKTPEKGAELANKLLDQCLPMMGIFDLFHGKDAHQRNDLFDKVAETILMMVVSHQRSTGDNRSFVTILNKALKFASGAHLREKIITNISIGDDNLKGEILEPIFKLLRSIQESTSSQEIKYSSITNDIATKLPEVASRLGPDSELFKNLCDSVAIVLRGISVDANNLNKDYSTAMSALQFALKLARSNELKARLQADMNQLNANISISRISRKPASSGCLVLFLAPGLAGASMVYHLLKLLV